MKIIDICLGDCLSHFYYNNGKITPVVLGARVNACTAIRFTSIACSLLKELLVEVSLLPISLSLSLSLSVSSFF